MVTRRHPTLTRYAAPAAFLAAVTVAVLIVRSGLSDGGTGAAPPATATAPGAPGAGGTATAPGTTASGAARFYRIRRGDTLETVAAKFDTTVERLLVLNPDVDPVALGIGERIRVK